MCAYLEVSLTMFNRACFLRSNSGRDVSLTPLLVCLSEAADGLYEKQDLGQEGFCTYPALII